MPRLKWRLNIIYCTIMCNKCTSMHDKCKLLYCVEKFYSVLHDIRLCSIELYYLCYIPLISSYHSGHLC